MIKKRLKQIKFWFDSISMVHKIIMFLLGLVGVGLMGNWYQAASSPVKTEYVEKYYPKIEIKEVPKYYPVYQKPEIITVDCSAANKDHEKRLHNVR